MKRAKQISESVELGIVLALCGGGMDAYSYLVRGHVFANGQTGNLVLMGIRLAEGNWLAAAQYGLPILSFVTGIVLADQARRRSMKGLHWRQCAVAAEAVILIVSALMPMSLNFLSNALTSLACGIQVESFRKIRGQGMATTMCVGNLRSATQYLGNFLESRQRQDLERCLLYFGVIFWFVLGAVLCYFLIPMFGQLTLLVPVAFLAAAFLIMFVDREKSESLSA